MTDLDQRIASTLRERAEGAVDTDLLTARAVGAGRARRRRRRVGAGAALGLVAVLGFGVTTGGLPVPTPSPAAAPVAPPRAPDAPVAAAAPELVGTDAGVLHFGVDTTRARYLGWESGRGVESVLVEVAGGRRVAIDVAPGPVEVERSRHEGMSYGPDRTASADFDGRVERLPPAGPGGQPGWVLRWRIGPLHARAITVGPDDTAVRTAVGALRMDRAHRCPAPLRLTTLPADAFLARCAVNMVNFPDSVDVTLTVGAPGEKLMDVRLERHSEFDGGRATGNRTIGGRPAYLHPGGEELELLGIPKAHLTARFGPAPQGFTEADAATVLGGARIADDLTRPESWD
ncbi:hypothetical protein KBX37_13340 [Micromonospora sp. U56]|uniref:hypothetical protein n=1 Tax=Micromonospora sp. U56 TaxID=2824900 RepID=UPI001B37D53D|nr:hypothetical protein [Micromonospora sp. U56]MBQ0894069.1 hypothetical protein [Micromonospora sp. U56]